MRHIEPPSSPDSSLFFIGKNSRGNWVVQDQAGARGGLFVDRAQALRFAMFENGHRPQAVVMVPGVMDLVGLPIPGLSTLTTSAPKSASSLPQFSPATDSASSTMRKPFSADTRT